MSEEPLLQRSKVRVRFHNEDMDYFFQWVLGAGILDIGEAFVIASQIKDGDPSSWSEQFHAYGQALQQRAEQQQRANQHRSAGETFLKAFSAVRAGVQFMSPKEATFQEWITAFKTCFQQGIQLLNLPIESVEVPLEGKTLPGYFWRADHDGTPRPTLLMIGGGDTYCEDLVGYIGAAGVQRGYHILAVDLPGQGDTPFSGLVFRPDFELPVKAVLNLASARKEVDMERFAIYGISGGGYIVTRATAYEKRIKACIANTPVYDVERVFNAEIPGALQHVPSTVGKTLMKLAGALNEAGRVNLEKFYWQGGVQNYQEFVRIAQAAKVEVGLIDCPMLCLAGEGDPPECIRQMHTCYEQLHVPKKAQHLFTVAEGADAHCQVNNPHLMHQVVFDWLDDVFAK